jgi:uncharacterized membrane protein (UPF0127 family)
MRHAVQLSLVRTLRFAVLAATLSGCGDKLTTMPGTTTTPAGFTVSFAGGSIAAEIAATPATRETGLMNRTSLDANGGMLFVFPGDEPVPPTPFAPGFWMRNTPIDLSIAFIDANKQVVTVDVMQANTETLHYAARPYRYALEASKGWFAAHNVAAGAQAAFTLPAGVVPSR